VCLYFFPNCFWCSQTGDHQQQDLPKLAIDQIWKAYTKKKSKNFFLFWLPAGNDSRNLAINNNNSLKIGKFAPIFHKTILHICQKSCFPVQKKMQNFL